MARRALNSDSAVDRARHVLCKALLNFSVFNRGVWSERSKRRPAVRHGKRMQGLFVADRGLDKIVGIPG